MGSLSLQLFLRDAVCFGGLGETNGNANSDGVSLRVDARSSFAAPLLLLLLLSFVLSRLICCFVFSSRATSLRKFAQNIFNLADDAEMVDAAVSSYICAASGKLSWGSPRN